MIKIIGRKDLRIGPLTNLTDGGEGSSGKIVKQSTRRKLSKALMGKLVGDKNPNYGNRWSEQLRSRVSRMRSGIPLKQAHKDKIRKAMQRFTGDDNPARRPSSRRKIKEKASRRVVIEGKVYDSITVACAGS